MNNFITFLVSHFILVLLLIILISILIIYEYTHRHGVYSIDSNELIHDLNNSYPIIIDVRDKSSFQMGHIIRSVNISLNDSI